MARLSRRTARLLLGLVGAPLLVALLLVVAEAVCALAGVSARHFFVATRGVDGGVEFVKGSDLPVEHVGFRVERFAARPPAGVQRILCVGDSTCYGHPFEPPAPFPCWIALRLKTLLPDVPTEVVNLGCTGFCSENVLDVVEDVDGTGAAVLVVYVGHNEFLDRNLLPLVEPTTAWIQRTLRRSRFGAVLDRLFAHPFDSTPFTEGIHSTLVHPTPLFDAAQFERGFRRFHDHLTRMVEIAKRRGAQVVFVQPVADARDTPVQHASFSAATSADARARFLDGAADLRRWRNELDDAAKEGRALDAAKLQRAFARLDELVQLDASVALLHYERARLLLLAGRTSEAQPEFELAMDADGYPVRSNRRTHATIDAVAREQGALVADPRPAFAAQIAKLAAGEPNDWFVDYCHPDLRGLELLADVVLHTMADANLLAPRERWRFAAEPTLEEYRQRAGYDPRMQAESWAKTALFDLGQSEFDVAATQKLRSAERLLERSRRIAPQCAPAWLGCGVLAAMHGKADEALDCFDHVVAIDPKSLEPLLEAYATTPKVRTLLTKAGLAVKDGRVTRAR